MGGGVMKLKVDAQQCTGHGRCYSLAPQWLSSDDEGYVTIRGESIEVPVDLLELADEIAGTCPEGAITLVDE
jgi:ferredoxin